MWNQKKHGNCSITSFQGLNDLDSLQNKRKKGEKVDNFDKRGQNILVAEQAVELDDKLVFLFGEIPTLEVRSQVVYPPQPATLPTP